MGPAASPTPPALALHLELLVCSPPRPGLCAAVVHRILLPCDTAALAASNRALGFVTSSFSRVHLCSGSQDSGLSTVLCAVS